jgi:hypothetical protein
MNGLYHMRPSAQAILPGKLRVADDISHPFSIVICMQAIEAFEHVKREPIGMVRYRLVFPKAHLIDP